MTEQLQDFNINFDSELMNEIPVSESNCTLGDRK